MPAGQIHLLAGAANLFLRIDWYKGLTLRVVAFLPVDPIQEFMEVELPAEVALAEIPGLMRFIHERLYNCESFQQIPRRQFFRLQRCIVPECS